MTTAKRAPTKAAKRAAPKAASKPAKTASRKPSKGSARPATKKAAAKPGTKRPTARPATKPAARKPAAKKAVPKRTGTKTAGKPVARKTTSRKPAPRPKKVSPRKSVSTTRNPNGKLLAPTVSAMAGDAWSSYWLSVKPVFGADTYEVQVSQDRDFTIDVNTRIIKRANSNAWFKNLLDGQTYFHRARAIRAGKPGPWSRVGRKTLLFYGIVEPAQNLHVAAAANHLDLSWDAAVTRSERPMSYRATMSVDRAGDEVVETHTTSDTKVRFSQAKADTIYYFRVFACTDGGRERGDLSRWAGRAQGSLQADDSADHMSISAVSPSGLTLRWPNPGPAAGYPVEITDTTFEHGRTLHGYPNQRSVNINDLAPDTEYLVRCADMGNGPGRPMRLQTVAENTRIRFGTWNVRYIDMDPVRSEHSWGKRREAVANHIVRNFDIVCIQEAATWRGSRTFRGKNQCEDLLHLLNAHELGADFAVAPTTDSASGVHVFYRTSVATAGESSHIRWRVEGKNRGQATIAKLDVAGTSMLVTSVHFSPYVEHAERAAHAGDLAGHLDRLNGEGCALVIVAGDFNSHAARTDEGPKALLCANDVGGTGLVDAEDHTPGRERTLVHSANTEWKSPIPQRYGHKIDYVLVDERIGVRSWNYIQTWTPTGRLRKPVPSDHHAIRTDLVLPA